MLRLKVERQPHWLDMPQGVRVQVRPLTTAVSEAAFADALERIRPVKMAADDAAKAGTPMASNEPNGSNAAWLQGLQWQYLVDALARYGILAWEGIGDELGDPLPVTPAACEAFAAHPDMGREFYRLYRVEVDAVEAEGNGSAPSASGDTAGAPSNVPTAQGEPSGEMDAESGPAVATAPAN